MQFNSALLIASLALVQGIAAAPVVVSHSDGVEVAHHLNKRNRIERSAGCRALDGEGANKLRKRDPYYPYGYAAVSAYLLSCEIEKGLEGKTWGEVWDDSVNGVKNGLKTGAKAIVRGHGHLVKE